MKKEHRLEFIAKQTLAAKWVAVMDRERMDRNMLLSDFKTRCIRLGEIHEFIVCDVPWGKRESSIDHVYYLGFAEFTTPGVISLGDLISIPSTTFKGYVLGFDETHMPNHQNILISTPEPCSGKTLSLEVGAIFTIENDRSFAPWL